MKMRGQKYTLSPKRNLFCEVTSAIKCFSAS
jgi:hypothetical protein